MYPLFENSTTRIAITLGGRRGWMLDRIQECEENGPGCDYPLSWSISPHLLYLAPDWLHWYYQLANQTGHDVFVLPPSGHLYAYPGKLLKFKAKPSAKIFKF